MLEYDFYFFVARTRKVFLERKGEVVVEPIPYNVFIERLTHLMEKENVIIIDEFQRLPEDFLDFLQYIKPRSSAKLVLVGSSIQVSKKYFQSAVLY